MEEHERNLAVNVVAPTRIVHHFGRGMIDRGRGGIYAKKRIPEDLPPEMAIPQLPEEAAGNLFAQLDKEWLPLVYANPEDEKRVKMMQAADKTELIRMAAQGQRDWYA